MRTVREPRPLPIPIPAILLEPDHTPAEQPAMAGPGARFALSPAATPIAVAAAEELPEAYGTKQIFLAARDPYWLFASWDLGAKQRRQYNDLSTSGSLTVRLRRNDEFGPIHLEIHTEPNSNDWFIHAGQPEATFVAELGYHEKRTGEWRQISVSKAVTTPADRVAPSVPWREVAPLQPLDLPGLVDDFANPPRAGVEPAEELVFAVPMPGFEARWNSPTQEIHFLNEQRYEGAMADLDTPPHFQEAPRMSEAPRPRMRLKAATRPRWSEKQAQALEELISIELRRMQQGSIEIEELLRRRTTGSRVDEDESLSSLDLLELGPEEALRSLLGLARSGAPSSLEAASVPEAPRKFWFRVNAELIIYGSTEPTARVSIGGRPIRLRSDGTFSYRFALPDGDYQLPVVAVAHDGHDARAADLHFVRDTQFIGSVGAHAQDPSLKTPSTANV